VAVPGLARIDPELLGGRSSNQVPGAFDVPGGEWRAVMPFDAGPQLEGQLLAVLAPRPARSEVGDDRVQAVLRHVLVEHDQIIEYAHHRTECGIVDSSWIDMLAGLVPNGPPKTPPDFSAWAGSHSNRPANNPPAAKLQR